MGFEWENGRIVEMVFTWNGVWNLTINFGYTENIMELLCILLAWVIIAVLVIRIYLGQDAEERPKLWKIIIAVLLGLFSFTFTFPLFNEPLSIAILPLGVWILYGILKRKGRWEAYRKYAWTGFGGNFIFLSTAILAIGLAGGFYPDDEVRTYLTDVSEVELLITHPSGEEVKINEEKFVESLSTFKYERSNVIQWFEEIREQIWPEEESEEPVEIQEKFPYLLIGVKTKTGDKIRVYVEQDGKGLLVTTKEKQHYYRSKTASFLEEGGNAE
ncbi:hypothetical protein [Sutcliffiella horikoshii]|uniref:Uncharacterized protein n=1 Tax=Sutcliffiella horikoshii TaxID=79883 RepID=A0A5D4T8B3_9BACI|nr:hypothetical protein [Sutcliffiella horikoshii]TYS71967.1 hypothetical protein FZC75_12510 [Sutcliffiella horikoshii]